MIKNLWVYQAQHTDPYENLAIEQYLLEQVAQDACILYLWQNQNTVVIGRNQNPWVECRTSLLEQEGGKLARRLSGGGAVFHDLGNLNFTFILPDGDYDVDKQLSVIQLACQQAGICVEKSGRNDLLAQGRKFSGNAFYHSQGHAYHHGTLLIRADMDKLQRYLSPSRAKLEAKGVSSVRSRVINLSELCPGLDIQTMKQNMIHAFSQVYGLPTAALSLDSAAMTRIRTLAQHNSSWDFLFGAPLPFTFSCAQHFSWGSIQLALQAKGGKITGVKVYSDTMDWQLPAVLEQALTGCRFEKAAMLCRLAEAPLCPEVRRELCQMLQSQDL